MLWVEHKNKIDQWKRFNGKASERDNITYKIQQLGDSDNNIRSDVCDNSCIVVHWFDFKLTLHWFCMKVKYLQK